MVKIFPKARNWIKEAKYVDKHDGVFVPTETTVDKRFEFWIENIVGDLAPNTLRDYRERYKFNIQPIIGKMAIANVKPMHCKKVLQKLLGHASIKATTDRYVHVTDDSMATAVHKFENTAITA